MRNDGALIIGITLGVMASFASGSTPSAGASSAASQLCDILASFKYLLSYIAGAIGVIVIVLQGIKWTASAEDPGARKQAKQGIIHAVIGLIIVVLAVTIVGMIFIAGQCDIT